MERFFDFSIGPEAEGFGLFSAVHGIYLAAAALSALLLCLFYRRSGAENRRRLRLVLASSALALELRALGVTLATAPDCLATAFKEGEG